MIKRAISGMCSLESRHTLTMSPTQTSHVLYLTEMTGSRQMIFGTPTLVSLFTNKNLSFTGFLPAPVLSLSTMVFEQQPKGSSERDSEQSSSKHKHKHNHFITSHRSTLKGSKRTTSSTVAPIEVCHAAAAEPIFKHQQICPYTIRVDGSRQERTCQ